MVYVGTSLHGNLSSSTIWSSGIAIMMYALIELASLSYFGAKMPIGSFLLSARGVE